MVRAIDATTNDGAAFLDVKITTRGREYLKALERQAYAASLQGRLHRFFASLGVHAATVITSVIASVVAAVITTVVMRNMGG